MPDQPVVLINAFKTPPEDGNRFLAAWDKIREYLETQPGYIDTAIHQSIIPGADFQFVNVAHWASAAAFHAAIGSPGLVERAAALADYKPHASPYRVVRTPVGVSTQTAPRAQVLWPPPWQQH
jgi:heme oxygenase (mycobilin-producing)